MPPPLGEGGALPVVLVLEVSGLKVEIPSEAGGLPAPVAFQVAVHDDASPLLRMRAVFGAEAEAEDFVALWPDVQRRLGKALWLNLLGYGPMVARLRVSKDEGPSVYMELRLSPQEMERFSKLGAQLILSKTAHLRPPPKGEAGVDAGPPDAGAASDAGNTSDAVPVDVGVGAVDAGMGSDASGVGLDAGDAAGGEVGAPP
jgi:hypothetical protein